MSDAGTDQRGGEVVERERPPAFGGTIFLQQAAHVAVVDARGRIITVNDAWARFGGDNGLASGYQFIGVSYPEICERAVDASHGNEGAREALGGINKVLAAEEKKFSLVYPCHAPQKQRWFLMYCRPIGGAAQGRRRLAHRCDIAAPRRPRARRDRSSRYCQREAKCRAGRANDLPRLFRRFGISVAPPTITVAWATPTATTSSTLTARN
jgi:hypothetical protein